MAEYRSKYTGAEVDALLGKVESGEVGGKVTVDSALSTTSENPVMNKVITEELGKKASIDGTYPDLTVGDLAGRGESVPAEFGFRASGGKSIKDGRAYIKRIKGNSVVWNQLYPTGWSITREGITSTSVNGKISAIGTTTETYFRFEPFVDNIADHKYLFMLSVASATFNGKRFGLLNRAGLGQATISNGFAYAFYTNTNASAQRGIGIQDLAEGTEINESLYINQIDLTKAFPNDWQNINTIEDFYARVATLGIDMNAYNEGQVIHCNTESIKSVGDNAWDEEWEAADFNDSGLPVASTSRIASKNFIQVLPNTQYYIHSNVKGNDIRVLFYNSDKAFISQTAWIGSNIKHFVTLANAFYIKFKKAGTTYDHDIMITLVHSGWKAQKDDQYQPYWQDTLPLPIIRKYFPNGMKSAGTAHDEIRYNKATKKWEAVQRIGSVDMGTYQWYKDSSRDFFKCEAPIQIRTYYLCGKYNNISNAQLGVDRGINVIDSGRGTTYLRISDLSYTNSEEFNASLQGVMLYYELAEPIVTELDAEDQNFRDYYNVADFGTEMSQSSVPSAPFSADIIYQFNAVDMIREHELEITELQNTIATMQAQLASLTSNNA